MAGLLPSHDDPDRAEVLLKRLKWLIIVYDAVMLGLSCWALSWLLNYMSIVMNAFLIGYSAVCIVGMWLDRPRIVKANAGLFATFAFLNFLHILMQVGLKHTWGHVGTSVGYVAFGLGGLYLTRIYIPSFNATK